MRELYFFGLYRALGHLKPRLHWGKEFNLTLNEVQIMYPKLDQFLAIRRVTDPHGIFVNELLANTLKLWVCIFIPIYIWLMAIVFTQFNIIIIFL